MPAPAPRDDATATDDRVYLGQGQLHASDSPSLMITTTLGSCVACCLHDPVRQIGGMNHFLLPFGQEGAGVYAERYGVHAMELLINGLLREGAVKERLQAKLFGGGQISPLLPDIGAQNTAFATHYLAHEGIRLFPGSVGGSSARKVQFWPATGRVRQQLIAEQAASRLERPNRLEATGGGALELFDS